MDELLFTGLAEMTPEDRAPLVAHVMDQSNWATVRGKKLGAEPGAGPTAKKGGKKGAKGAKAGDSKVEDDEPEPEEPAAGRKRKAANSTSTAEGAGAIVVFPGKPVGKAPPAAATLARRAEALVSETERAELMGNAARMISRAFARTVLMRYDEDARDARDVTFAYGARGKPSVRGPATLAARCGFSVSHCDGLTAVAVTTNGDACGIDVEDENRRIGTDVGKFARRWLSDDETRRLSDIVADDERARAFMRLWTAKESYVKALGLGIAGRPFREFDIAWDVAEDAAKTWSMDLRDVTDDGTVPWRFALLKPRASQSHVMSLCAPAGADGRMPRVRVRWASPFEPLVDVDAADADVLALGGSRATI